MSIYIFLQGAPYFITICSSKSKLHNIFLKKGRRKKVWKYKEEEDEEEEEEEDEDEDDDKDEDVEKEKKEKEKVEAKFFGKNSIAA